jgi:hypothetical protein
MVAEIRGGASSWDHSGTARWDRRASIGASAIGNMNNEIIESNEALHFLTAVISVWMDEFKEVT